MILNAKCQLTRNIMKLKAAEICSLLMIQFIAH